MKKVDDDKDISSIKPARIPKKEMPTQSQQGHATEGATPFQGLSAGADTREQKGNAKRDQIREQSMGMCTVQMIRLADDRPSPRPNKVEQ